MLVKKVVPPDGPSIEENRNCRRKSQNDLKLVVGTPEDPLMRLVITREEKETPCKHNSRHARK